MPIATALYKFLGANGYMHPVHPALVHMPIGLVIGAMILAYAAPFLPKLPLERAAYYTLVLAFVFYFPTVIWGYLDWQYFFSGGWFFYIEMKLTLAAVLLVLITLGLILGRKAGGTARPSMSSMASPPSPLSAWAISAANWSMPARPRPRRRNTPRARASLTTIAPAATPRAATS